MTEHHETPDGVSSGALHTENPGHTERHTDNSGRTVDVGAEHLQHREGSREPANRTQQKDIPQATVTRLATYLRALAVLADEGVLIVSSEELAVAAGVGSAKLRKDLSFLGPNGVRGVGYDVAKLRARIEDVLGLSEGHRVILVGAGNLGRALIGYGGFRRRGFSMAGIFDADPRVIGETVSGLVVRDIAQLRAAATELAPTIAVITVPDSAAQAVCDQLVAVGVQCILSFSPTTLEAPSSVEVRRVDLAVEMQMLSFERARSAEAQTPDGARSVAAGETVTAVSTPIGRRLADPGGHQAFGNGAKQQGIGGRTMSVLLVGISHRSAPVAVLEKVAVTEENRPKLTDRMLASQHISEAMIVSTCNRVEVYAIVDAFHGGLGEVGDLLARHSGLPLAELTKHAYVRYSEAAAEHLVAVASGLDSMVVGEQQVRSQIRAAYAAADAQQAAGRTLHELAQHALRVGQRVHAETGLDRAGASVVSVARDRARTVFSAGADDDAFDTALAGRSAVVVGAGAMGGLAVAHLARAGVGHITVVNRTAERAERLAHTAIAMHGASAASADLSELIGVLADADVVLTSTGAVGSVVTLADAHRALNCAQSEHQMVICDLGLPRDVDSAVAGLPNVTVIDMETLQHDPAAGAAADDTTAARSIVAEELAKYLAGQRMAEVTPTVAALRQRAAEVVEAEMFRLESKLPDLADPERQEVGRTVRRVVDKLLHAPTVRVKQLASTPGGDTYAEALRELFELKPGAAQAVAAPMEVAALGELADDFVPNTPGEGQGHTG